MSGGWRKKTKLVLFVCERVAECVCCGGAAVHTEGATANTLFLLELISGKPPKALQQRRGGRGLEVVYRF